VCDCEYGKEIVLNLPDHLIPWKERRTVCVEACVVDQIQARWDANIETLGGCCGHDKEPPSVIIEKHYTKLDVEVISHILESNDTRGWTVLQWKPEQLMAVAPIPTDGEKK